MKLSTSLVTKTSQNLDKAVTSNKSAVTETSTLVLQWLKDKSAKQVFLDWLTAKSKAVKDELPVDKLARQQSVKNFQNVINATPFQRLYFNVEQGKALTETIRVKKAQTGMIEKGVATLEQVDSKKYFDWVSKIEPTIKTAKSEMKKIKDAYKLSNKELSAIANTLD